MSVAPSRKPRHCARVEGCAWYRREGKPGKLRRTSPDRICEECRNADARAFEPAPPHGPSDEAPPEHAELLRAVPPTIGERMNKRWADAIGADPSGYDLTQLLRVPNTINYTDPDAPLVRLIRVTDLRSVPVELDAMLPPLEGEHLHDGEHAPDNAESENGHGPPVRLGEAYMRLWRGETPVLKDDGSVDRSMTLRAIGLAVARGGGTVPPVAEALRDRDEALGLHKATRRRDGGSGIATRPPAR